MIASIPVYPDWTRTLQNIQVEYYNLLHYMEEYWEWFRQ